MKPFSPAPAITLAPRAVRSHTTLPLQDHTGQRVACLDGEIWITQQNDPRDVVLAPGECFVLDRPGLALVFAFRDAILTVSPPAPDDVCAC
jgi:hypothetical protein